MISRQEFPYLQQLVVNDAYAVKNLTIPVFEQGKEFKHLILTGKNGSGKTTVIRSIVTKIQYDIANNDKHKDRVKHVRRWIKEKEFPHRTHELSQELFDLTSTDTIFRKNRWTIVSDVFPSLKGMLIAYFPANRSFVVNNVTAPKVENELLSELDNPKGAASFIAHFKQYLVNKKVSQALAQIDGNKEKSEEYSIFFKQIESAFSNVFNDKYIKLKFISESYDFLLNLQDGRELNFNQLSAGFSAFLSILMDLLMRTDLLRKQANDYTYDPCGFVLIDEPETHLHLEMQYQILPLLTSLFPNLQFIVATHSPAVASSITGTTVFDLSTGEVMGDEAAGSSFSELMQTHFGVENEYSNVADAILEDIKNIVKISDKNLARQKLLQLLEEKGKYMSAGLRLEVEAQLIGLE